MWLRLPQLSPGQCIGHILLFDIMPGEVMRIKITVMIAEVCHQLGGSIAQVERHRLVAG